MQARKKKTDKIMSEVEAMHTQTGKRVVSNSIILSYWVIPLEVLPGISPDAFVTALHTSWEYLITTQVDLLEQKPNNCNKPNFELEAIIQNKKENALNRNTKILHTNRYLRITQLSTKAKQTHFPGLKPQLNNYTTNH